MKKNNIPKNNKNIPISIPINPNIESKNVRISKKHNKKRLLKISLLSILTAIASSLVAKLLVFMIDLFTNIAFYGKFSLEHATPAANSLGIFVVIIPAIGGIIIGLIAFYGSKAIRGHGIPEAMEQILINDSKIKPTIAFLKPLSSAISIGTGGPFGAEGPIIATGGALGSTFGQLLKITSHERKILLTAGATAGMSAIFGSPVAAIFLAIELLLFEFSSRSIIPVALACITGAVGHKLLFGSGPVFPAPIQNIPSNTAIAIYILIGLLMGLSSVFSTKMVYFIEGSFERLPIHWMMWPAISGIVVGIIGFFAPNTLGVGYENITSLLSGNLPVRAILALCVLKFLSWSIALGSGTSGGTLAPLLTIGGAGGSLLGSVFIYLFPQSDVSLSLAALVGMAAIFAGSTRALLTSIIFALETTLQSNALLPLLGACAASYIVSFFSMKTTIMTEKIARRGIHAPHSYEPDILEKIHVKQVIKEIAPVLSTERTIGETREWLKETADIAKHFVLTDNDGAFKGIISLTDIYTATNDEQESLETLVGYKSGSVSAGSNLLTAVEIMARKNIDVLPVVSEDDSTIIGILSFKDIISAYKYRIEEFENHEIAISLKRQGIRIISQGKKLAMRIKERR